ncbi:MAG: trypsin-like peptidase domain-containing protein [Parafilimonas terrae]|nr:trypsin-like peptidase domain-containing protein [Parafilimonas terrae]
MGTLSAQQIDALSRLLVGSLDFRQLERFVFLGTGDRLYDEYVTDKLPLRPTIEALLDQLERNGTTDRFLGVVYREKVFQTELRARIAALFPAVAVQGDRQPVQFDLQVAGRPQPLPGGAEQWAATASGRVIADAPGLERTVKPALSVPDLRVWLDKIERLERQVCRVEAADAALGTGFLVGPQTVLTNWHVVREARRRGTDDRLACRFDYRRLTGGGVDAGQVISVTSVVDERPCSAAEFTAEPDEPPPAADELDYALLRLAEPQPQRGSVAMRPAPPVAQGAALVIVQHPEGEPMRFALDTEAAIGFVQQGRRLRYRTNTEAGSSGSPCMTMDLDLVALHHLGDPSYGGAKYNQGIPIDLVVASLRARGHLGLLEA